MNKNTYKTELFLQRRLRFFPTMETKLALGATNVAPTLLLMLLLPRQRAERRHFPAPWKSKRLISSYRNISFDRRQPWFPLSPGALAFTREFREKPIPGVLTEKKRAVIFVVVSMCRLRLFNYTRQRRLL